MNGNGPRHGPALQVRPAAPAFHVGGHAELPLVAEAGGRVLGRLTLRAAIGALEPRWWYHVGCAVHAAADLGLFHRQSTLLLGNDLTGAAELADIETTADGEAAAAVLDALLAHALAEARGAPQAWGTRVIAELPGVRDAQGRSPFWHGLGRHFHGGDVEAEIARLGAAAWRRHVAALLPRQVVYTSFLDAAAQEAIGQEAAPAGALRDALNRAGLHFAGHVRIDDGGPVLEAGFGG